MMNADLAEVSKKHGVMGHPLRNRSTSSNSREGSKTRGPDPNRYKKYLSLRNRKIVDNQHRQLEESSSQHTASQRTLDNRATAAQQDDSQGRPLQPILKSTSSRISDLRFRDGGSLHKTSSTDSLPPLSQPGLASTEQLGAMTHTATPTNHSPLRSRSPTRQKSPSPIQTNALAKQHSRNGSIGLDENDGSRQRSPIPVYNTATVAENTTNNSRKEEFTLNPAKHATLSQESPTGGTSQKRQKQRAFERSGRSRRQSQRDPYKSTTEVEDSEFNFDFDQEDGAQSYVNTTMQSQSNFSPRDTRRMRTTTGISSHVNSQSIKSIKKLNELEEEPPITMPKKSSILAYTEELKDQVETGGRSDRSESETRSEQSSGYVIDYEQVLKDNQMREAMVPVDYRKDYRPDTILEQTQEANESSETLDEDYPPKKRSQVTSPEKSNRQQDSPQFRELKQISDRKGSKESPIIRQTNTNTRNTTDYYPQKGKPFDSQAMVMEQNDYAHQEPVLTFENRQAQSSKRSQDNTGRFMRKSPLDSDNETTTFRPTQQQQVFGRAMQNEPPSDSEQYFVASGREYDDPNTLSDRSPDHALQQYPQQTSSVETTSFKRNTLLQEDDQDTDEHQSPATPYQLKQKQVYGVESHIDMDRSNKKISDANREIDEEFQRQCEGSAPPSTNLVVTCIIRQPMDTIGVKSKYRSLHNSATGSKGKQANDLPQIRNVSSTERIGIAGSMRVGMSSSVGPSKRHSLNKSQNGLDVSRASFGSANRSASRPRILSNDSRLNLSAGGKRRKSSASKPGTASKVANADKYPHILTTTHPSRYVLRSPAGLQAQLLNILLKSEQDVKHCQLAFDEHGLQSKQNSRKNMKVFEFDNCVGETKGHSLAIGLDANVKWINQVRSAIQKSNPPKNVIFLFGQSDALKSQLLNVMQGNSLINQCIKAREIRFLRVSMYHLGQEYLLAHKTFGNKAQMRREIGMEIREAFRERDLNCKKIALKLSTYSRTVKAEDVKMGSHLIVQIDDLVIVELADIDNLKDPTMAKKISADFSVVTNAILSMSTFYKDHDFGKVDEDRLAPYRETNNFRTGSVNFKAQIQRLVSRRSRILLLCCVVQCSVAGTQAVDYCHKIRSYFHGNSTDSDPIQGEQTPSRRMQVAQGDVSMETDQNVGAFRQLGGLISEVSKARLFIDKIFSTKARGEPLKRSRNQLKEMVACLRDDVSDLLNSLAATNQQYVAQLAKIREILQQEIYYMREKVAAMRSLGRRNSVGASSHKSGGNLCILPKNLLTSHQSNQNQKQNQLMRQDSASFSMPQIATNQPKIHNFRQNSQSSLHSNGHGSRPQSGRQSGRQNTSRTRNPIQTIYNNHTDRRPSANLPHQHPQPLPSRTKSQSCQSRKTMASKHITGTPQDPRIRSDAQANTNYSGRKPRESSTMQKPRRSQESFTQNQASNERSVSASRRSITNQASQRSLKNRRASGSKKGTVTRNNLNQSSGMSNPLLAQNFSNNNIDLGAVDSNDDLGNNSKSAFSTQQLTFPLDPTAATKDDFRKQTLSSLNQQYFLSGTKSSGHVVRPESNQATPLAHTEAMHQEIGDLREQLRITKEQLRSAIDLTEEQAGKRKSAEENCIRLTKELTQTEIQVADLEDRVIAKDQTIRSLESQVDFLKDKVANKTSAPAQYQAEPPAQSVHMAPLIEQENAHHHEFEALRQEKAQTDQMNQEILGQISQLKEALSSFQDQDRHSSKMNLQQARKDQEMEELKQQVAQLINQNIQQQKIRQASPDSDTLHMQHQIEQLEKAKDKYREEALHLRQQARQQRYPVADQDQHHVSTRSNKERQRTKSSNGRKESQDREPLHLHSKLAGSNNNLAHHSNVTVQQDQQVIPQHMPQQKSLSTIKNMIRDFKEQRRGLMRTTSSREALMQSRELGKGAAGLSQASSTYKRQNLRQSRSRENDVGEINKNTGTTGYSQLNKHFR